MEGYAASSYHMEMDSALFSGKTVKKCELVPRDIVVHSICGTRIGIKSYRIATVYELKKAIETWFKEKQDRQVSPVWQRLISGCEELDSGSSTLEDIADRLNEPLSLVLDFQRCATQEDYGAFLEFTTEDEFIRMIQDRMLAWKFREPVNLHELDAMTPEEVACLVKEMEQKEGETLQSRRNVLGLEHFGEAEKASGTPRRRILDDMYIIGRVPERLLQRLPDFEDVDQSLLCALLSAGPPQKTGLASWIAFQLCEKPFVYRLKQQAEYVAKLALYTGTDLEHVKNIMTLVYHGMDADSMIAHLVKLKYWRALKEQLSIQPELLAHRNCNGLYIDAFPGLYESVLPNADWSLVQLLLDANLQVDMKSVLVHMEEVNHDEATKRVGRFLGLNVDPTAAMVWVAGDKRPTLLKMLIDARVDPSQALPNNNSMLAIAVDSQQPENIHLLLAAGARVTEDVIEMVDARTTKQEARVEWVKSRQGVMRSDFAYCYDDRRKILCQEEAVLENFRVITGRCSCITDKDNGAAW